MEIKRRLNAVAKRITPEIEAMNISSEMKNMCKRFEELANYGEEKCARAKANREGRESMGAKQDREAKAERARIQKIHDAEADELAKDREQENAQPDVVEEPDAGGKSSKAK